MKFKQTLAAILAICMVLTLAVPVSAVEVIETGTLSEEVTYTLYDEGSLYIEGTGTIPRLSEALPDTREELCILNIQEGITAIADNAFWHCPSLQIASVPSTVKTLNGTFGNCVALWDVTLREGLEVIGADAFVNCSSLSYVYIPSTVTTIGDYAFSGCSSLYSIYICDGLTTIGDYAFVNSKLNSVTLPASLTSIGEGAFEGCNDMWEIVFLGGPVALPDSLFSAGSSIDIYYPDGQGWNLEDFKDMGRAATWIPYTLDESGNRIPDESRAYTTGVAYSMDDAGALTVSGIGQITYDIELYNLYSGATSLDVQDGITEIGDSAFASYSLKSVSIAGTVTRIGKSAFSFCSYLNSVVLSEGLEEIGANAFSICWGLKEITIPASVTLIEDLAFHTSDNLSTVTFLGDPPAFGEDIFISSSEKSADLVIYYPDNGNWTQEDLLYLGKTATWIPYTLDESGNRIPDESRAYVAEFKAVTSGTFEGGGSWYIDDAGVLHIEGAEYVGTELSHYDHWENITGLETKDLTHAYFTFSDHTTLASVSFSDDMTQAGYFRNCDALTDVNLGNGMERLLSDMFVDCDGLKVLTIPASVERIEDNAVNGCVNLESVTFLGSAPSYIGTGAFRKVGKVVFYYPANDPTWTEEVLQAPLGCSAVWTPYTLDADGKMIADDAGAVTVHSAVDQWENGDFTCTLYSDGTIKVEGAGDFTGVPSWDMWLKATHIEVCEGITSISSIGSLYSYENEVTVTLASSVTEIGPEAFWGCEAITSLDLQYVTTIGANAFHASAIETVVLSDQLTEIPEFAFWEGSLKSIVIPDSVTTIGENAFKECHNLEYVELGKSVRDIGAGAFERCENLTEIAFPESMRTIGNRAFAYTGLVELVLPDGMVSLGTDVEGDNSGWYNGAFVNCDSLVTVVLPEGLTHIPNGCFSHCDQLEYVAFSDTVESIGQSAFEGCIELKKVDFGASLNVIGANAFYECGQLSQITFREGCGKNIGEYAFFATGITELILPDGPTVLSNTAFVFCNELTRIVFPEGLEEIPEMCFSGLPKLESIQISDSVRTIGKCAFQGCTSLKTVDFGMGVGTIEERAFYGCASLTVLDIPGSVSVIGISAFEECTGLHTVTLHEGLEYISDGAFLGSGLTEVTIPNTVLDLGYGDSVIGAEGDNEATGAFQDCLNLSKVTILSEHITRIPYGCFAACPGCLVMVPPEEWEWSALKECKLPNSIRVIEGRAFHFNSITDLVIPENVERIDAGNFIGCDSLANVYFTGETPPEIYCSFDHVIGYYPEAYAQNYLDCGLDALFVGWLPYTVAEDDSFVTGTEIEESEAVALMNRLMAKYPEGYSLDQYSVAVLNGTDLVGYGSQAFAYILSDEIFGSQPTSVDTTVTFDEVMVGDILRLDNDTRSVVITEVRNDHVVVAQGDWQGTSAAAYSLRTASESGSGTVHWGETLSIAQVEAANYRITRYEGKLNQDLSAVTSTEPELPTLETENPTGKQVREFLLSLESSFPEGYPYTTEIKYTTTADMTGMQLSPIGQGCSAFAFQTSDRIFGDAPMREILDIDFDDVMVGDILHYDPDPNDNTTHVVVVLEIYADHLVTVEANYNASIHWGRVFTREEVEAMMGHYTRYPAGTVTPEPGDSPYVLGDVNGDEEIDILDANLVVAWYNEIRELEDNQLLAADVNGDGEVDIMDANMIVAYYNEVIDAFPAQH